MFKIIDPKRKYLYLFLLLIGFVFLLGTYFINKETASSMVISLNYELASKGLNPNHTRFNSYEIKSDEVIGEVIRKLKIENKISQEELLDCIEIGNTSKKEDYILTDYLITYRPNKNIADINSEIILSTLFDSYREYFIKNYTYDNSILEYKEIDFTDLEYLSVIEKIEVEVKQIKNYINDRMKDNVSLFSEDELTLFQSLNKQAENILLVDLSNLKTYVVENGVAKNKDLITDIFSYKNEMLNIELKTNKAAYNTRQEAIELYNSTLFPSVSVPSVNNNEYYISTTKTGLDYVFEAAQSYLNSSLDAQHKISENDYTIEKITSISINKEKEEHVVSELKNIEKKVIELSKEVKKTDDAYIEYKTRQYLSRTIKGEKN